MASLTDFLARTFYVSADDVATHDQVAAAQAAIVQRQLDQGKRDAFSAAALQSDIAAASGSQFYDAQLGQSGVAGLPGLAASYWWLTLPLALLAFGYFGGFAWLRRNFKS